MHTPVGALMTFPILYMYFQLSSKDATVLQAVSKIGPMSEEEAFNAIMTQSPVLASNLTLLKSKLYNKIINMEGRHSKQFAYDVRFTL